MSYKSKLVMTSPYLRVEGVAVKTQVKGSAGLLHRIVVSNHNAAAQTLTVLDDTDIITDIHLPGSAAFGSVICLEFGIQITTSLEVTPSHNDVDALVIYD